MKKIILYMLISLYAVNSMGQIEGEITSKDGKYLPKIRVIAVDSVSERSDTIMSDKRGFYYFPRLKPGKYKLLVNTEGYELFVSKFIEVGTPPPGADEGSDTYYAVRYYIILNPAKRPD